MFGHTLPQSKAEALVYLETFDDINLETGKILTQDEIAILFWALYRQAQQLGVTEEEVSNLLKAQRG